MNHENEAEAEISEKIVGTKLTASPQGLTALRPYCPHLRQVTFNHDSVSAFFDAQENLIDAQGNPTVSASTAATSRVLFPEPPSKKRKIT